MNPIQTTYAGCRFRSRLEARWAVFFDSLKLNWEYEKEGYELSDGRKYLPDFWLPDMDCFFDVIGTSPTDHERCRAVLLSAESKKLVALASGTMRLEDLSYGAWHAEGFNIELFAGKAHEMWKAKAHQFPMWNFLLETDLPPFIQSLFPLEKIPLIDTEHRRKIIVRLDRLYYLKKYGEEHPNYVWGRHEKSVYWLKNLNGGYEFAIEPDVGISKITIAYKAARSALFESGEGPGKI